MLLIEESIPDLDAPVPSAPPSEVGPSLHEIHRLAVSRRGVIRGMLVGAGALAVSGVGMLAGPAQKAFAATGPKGETEHTNCGGYEYSGGTCFGGKIGSYYCNSSKWHLTTGWSMTCSSGHYYIAWGRCASREAWRWTTSGVSYRCADGYQIAYSCGGPSNGTKTWTICQARL